MKQNVFCFIFQDLAYFFLRSGLSDRVDLGLHKNPSLSKTATSSSSSKSSPDREFWSRVSPENLLRVVTAYRLDFEMLGANLC